jgi:hypothetical protein
MVYYYSIYIYGVAIGYLSITEKVYLPQQGADRPLVDTECWL